MMSYQHKLIIIEGLTGLGKSTMAHLIARQLGYNGICARWIHEGEIQHPTSIEVENGLSVFMEDSIKKWEELVSQIKVSNQVCVTEASFFNNLIESLFSHCLEQNEIIAFGLELQQVIEPINPALVYLTHYDVPVALKENFKNRGEGFKDFVIRYVESTPIAKVEGWVGDAGVVTFLDTFVSLTNLLFHKYHIDKISLDVSSEDWHVINQRVTKFLSLHWHPDPIISKKEAENYTGTYRIQAAETNCSIEFHDGSLITDLFLNVKTRLIPKHKNVFIVEKWHFEIIFEQSDDGDINSFSVAGIDVDYLKAVGLKAEKVNK